MHYYLIYGMKIVSDFALLGCDEIKAVKTADVIIKKEKDDLDFSFLIDTKLEPEAESDFLYMWKESTCILYKPNNGVFIVDNQIIRYQLMEGYDEQSIKQMILTNCIPVIRSNMGLISLHGSCIYLNNKAYIISGESGAGKSTFATEVLNNGAKFMADDICAISFRDNEPIVHAALPERKLCKDAALHFGYDLDQTERLHNIRKGKYLVKQKMSFWNEDTLLGGVIIIKPCNIEAVQMFELKGGQKLQAILDNLFGYIINNKEDKQRIFNQCIKIAQRIPVYRLERSMIQDTTKELFSLFNKIIEIG